MNPIELHLRFLFPEFALEGEDETIRNLLAEPDKKKLTFLQSNDDRIKSINKPITTESVLCFWLSQYVAESEQHKVQLGSVIERKYRLLIVKPKTGGYANTLISIDPLATFEMGDEVLFRLGVACVNCTKSDITTKYA